MSKRARLDHQHSKASVEERQAIVAASRATHAAKRTEARPHPFLTEHAATSGGIERVKNVARMALAVREYCAGEREDLVADAPFTPEARDFLLTSDGRAIAKTWLVTFDNFAVEQLQRFLTTPEANWSTQRCRNTESFVMRDIDSLSANINKRLAMVDGRLGAQEPESSFFEMVIKTVPAESFTVTVASPMSAVDFVAQLKTLPGYRHMQISSATSRPLTARQFERVFESRNEPTTSIEAKLDDVTISWQSDTRRQTTVNHVTIAGPRYDVDELKELVTWFGTTYVADQADLIVNAVASAEVPEKRMLVASPALGIA